jgi:hypothetical protein
MMKYWKRLWDVMRSTRKSNKKHLLSLKQVNMAKNKSQSQYPDPEFKEYLNQLSNPNYQGGSWVLPDNPTPPRKNQT